MDLFVVYLTTLVSNSDYIASNEGVVSEWWIGKDVEGSVHGLISRYYPSICLEKRKKTTKNLSQDSCLRVDIWTRDLPNTKQEY
jgi:hypothetical protein